MSVLYGTTIGLALRSTFTIRIAAHLVGTNPQVLKRRIYEQELFLDATMKEANPSGRRGRLALTFRDLMRCEMVTTLTKRGCLGYMATSLANARIVNDAIGAYLRAASQATSLDELDGPWLLFPAPALDGNISWIRCVETKHDVAKLLTESGYLWADVLVRSVAHIALDLTRRLRDLPSVANVGTDTFDLSADQGTDGDA